ncbi:hypothetical protein HDU92_009038 [Lobulomyces angularis]|nr:hypothetical protein HDU92_009038 [Lobulomyces angularis]
MINLKPLQVSSNILNHDSVKLNDFSTSNSDKTSNLNHQTNDNFESLLPTTLLSPFFPNNNYNQKDLFFTSSLDNSLSPIQTPLTPISHSDDFSLSSDELKAHISTNDVLNYYDLLVNDMLRISTPALSPPPPISISTDNLNQVLNTSNSFHSPSTTTSFSSTPTSTTPFTSTSFSTATSSTPPFTSTLYSPIPTSTLYSPIPTSTLSSQFSSISTSPPFSSAPTSPPIVDNSQSILRTTTPTNFYNANQNDFFSSNFTSTSDIMQDAILSSQTLEQQQQNFPPSNPIYPLRISPPLNTAISKAQSSSSLSPEEFLGNIFTNDISDPPSPSSSSLSETLMVIPTNTSNNNSKSDPASNNDLKKIKKNKKVINTNLPHKCPRCIATFATEYQLITHSIKHAEVRPFGCKNCSKTFSRHHDALRHVKNVHKVSREEAKNFTTDDKTGYFKKAKS